MAKSTDEMSKAVPVTVLVERRRVDVGAIPDEAIGVTCHAAHAIRSDGDVP